MIKSNTSNTTRTCDTEPGGDSSSKDIIEEIAKRFCVGGFVCLKDEAEYL
jgi:hypothetical protein